MVKYSNRKEVLNLGLYSKITTRYVDTGGPRRDRVFIRFFPTCIKFMPRRVRKAVGSAPALDLFPAVSDSRPIGL